MLDVIERILRLRESLRWTHKFLLRSGWQSAESTKLPCRAQGKGDIPKRCRCEEMPERCVVCPKRWTLEA